EVAQPHRRLDQPLVEAPLVAVALRPQVFPQLVRLEKVLLVEQDDPRQVSRIIGAHARLRPRTGPCSSPSHPSSLIYNLVGAELPAADVPSRVSFVLGSRLSLSDLIELCRVMRHYLGAGLSLLDVFRQLQRRSRASLQALAVRVTPLLESGESLEHALK